MIQSWQISVLGVLGVLVLGAGLAFLGFGLKRRPPSLALTGSGILAAIFGLALLYAAAFPTDRPALLGYLFVGGLGTADLGLAAWVVSDIVPLPVNGRLRPYIVDRRCRLRLAGGFALIGGEAVALFVLHPAFAAALLIVAAFWLLWWLPSSRRRTTSAAVVLIDRPVREVFDFMSSHENGPRYIPELKEVVRLTEGPVAKGTVVRIRTANFEWQQEVVEFIPLTSISEHVLDGEVNRATTRFESIDGRTRVSFSYEQVMSLARALSGDGVHVARLRRELPERRQAWFENLKDVLEAKPPS